jgi:hypothetical protein
MWRGGLLVVSLPNPFPAVFKKLVGQAFLFIPSGVEGPAVFSDFPPQTGMSAPPKDYGLGSGDESAKRVIAGSSFFDGGSWFSCVVLIHSFHSSQSPGVVGCNDHGVGPQVAESLAAGILEGHNKPHQIRNL